MRFAKIQLFIARGAYWAVLTSSALQLIDPACAAELPSSAAQATVASIEIKRDGIPFGVAIYRPPSEQSLGAVVLLTAFPGTRIAEGFTSREQSLAVALAKSGYGVVRFNYVGSWANTGLFSWFGGVLDTEAVLRFLLTEEARSLGIDGSRIVLVGHSYGGWVALMAAARDPAIRCAAVMASANLGVGGKLIRDDVIAYKRSVAFYEEVLSEPKHPIRAQSASALADDTVEHAEAWDLVNHVEQLRSRQLLFISGEQDEFAPREIYVQPLIDALRRSNATMVRAVTIKGADHSFRREGVQVNEMLEDWITKECKLNP
jgi:dipeptidyl aminopeptidase/acylaminoacyl peptidase